MAGRAAIPALAPRDSPLKKHNSSNLPNRFPSVLSLDFRKEQGHYVDFENLFAMYVLYNMGRYSVGLNGETKLLEIEKAKRPMAYPEAAKLATKSAQSDRKNFLRRHTENEQWVIHRINHPLRLPLHPFVMKQAPGRCANVARPRDGADLLRRRADMPYGFVPPKP